MYKTDLIDVSTALTKNGNLLRFFCITLRFKKYLENDYIFYF